MPRRNSERQLNRPENAEVTAPGVLLLVWRKCPVCGSETEGIEPQDATPLCQRCQAPMEQQAVAPADSYKKQNVRTTRGAKTQPTRVRSLKRGKPKR